MRRGYSIGTHNRPSVYLGEPRRMRRGDVEDDVIWNVTGGGSNHTAARMEIEAPIHFSNPDDDDEQNACFRWTPSWVWREKARYDIDRFKQDSGVSDRDARDAKRKEPVGSSPSTSGGIRRRIRGKTAIGEAGETSRYGSEKRRRIRGKSAPKWEA